MKKARGVLIAGNWKMNHGPRETTQFFSTLGSLGAQEALKADGLEAWVIPPALSMGAARAAAESLGAPVHIAAQNAHWEKKGAFTGEISGPMLQELGIERVLIGHSERRQYFGETDETCHKRAHALLEQGLQVMLCIGETRAEREQGRTFEVLRRQLTAVLNPSASKELFRAKATENKFTIAYEPVWAIGTGLTATPEQAEEAHQAVRKVVGEFLGQDVGARIRILYGGSVTLENVRALLACVNIDGALVGGASLKPESFLGLLQAGAQTTG